ncbi:sigma-70 family RNA polymerase sigma factor [Hyphococcus luteus]|uniref:RNA polymerase sigma factor SigJ n=1 Tax=Hyphococcus luteus TaxID=2058213 RepID=A0A2S7JZP8_9PROT|nr:sigma-70 family RNA polymerase sigma factor [Marinicaulis flavus]PQA85735.1 RNA polymerase sigma factor SigJ [Marinicaulis flavus]
MTRREDTFVSHRGRLLGLAYRMLGSMSDAEDTLQDAWLRFSQARETDIRSAEGYLVTIVTRLCLDRLKSAQRRRERYVGPWLPEPVVDTDAMTPETMLEFADDLSFALLLTLERLSPPERAAFLLHDVFGASYGAVAEALDKTEAACRQLAARARKAVRSERPDSKAPAKQHEALLAQFAAATASGDITALKHMLADDAVAYADGGGVKIAALNPIYGAERVARFFAGVFKKANAEGISMRAEFGRINTLPAILTYADGTLDQTMSIDVKDGKIAALYVVRNPEKLSAVAGRDGA